MTRRPLPINEPTKEEKPKPPQSPLPTNRNNARIMPLTENRPETPQIIAQDNPVIKPKPKPKF
jgi:hypothetical protein